MTAMVTGLTQHSYYTNGLIARDIRLAVQGMQPEQVLVPLERQIGVVPALQQKLPAAEGFLTGATARFLLGAGDIIEIIPIGSGDALMLPFNETTVPKIDIAGKQIVVVLPAEIEARDE